MNTSVNCLSLQSTEINQNGSVFIHQRDITIERSCAFLVQASMNPDCCAGSLDELHARDSYRKEQFLFIRRFSAQCLGQNLQTSIKGGRMDDVLVGIPYYPLCKTDYA